LFATWSNDKYIRSKKDLKVQNKASSCGSCGIVSAPLTNKKLMVCFQ
jgi:hypothetical protein